MGAGGRSLTRDIQISSTVAIVLVIVVFCVCWIGTASSYAQPSQKSLNATGQVIVDNIKEMCRESHPDSEQTFRACAIERCGAMKNFFAKLFYYRDTQGMQSHKFKIGITCLENASPIARKKERKFITERADWISANTCYETALR